MSGISDAPDPDDPEPGWLDKVRVFYPYLSALVFGPLCLNFGWHWLAVLFTAVAVLVVIRGLDPLRLAFLALLLWNSTELLLALCLILCDLNHRLKALPDAAQ